MGETEQMIKKHKYYRSIFDKYDRDHNNLLNIHELKRIITEHDAYDNDIPTYVVEQILHMSDLDGDGNIDFTEFVYMIEHPALKQYFRRYLYNYIKFLVPPAQLRVNKELQRTISYTSGDTVDGTGQYEELYSCCPPPLNMLLFSLVEIILFVIDGATSNGSGKIAQALMLNPNKKEEVWRFVSYMFVHIGYLHLITNVLIQLILAVPLEMVHNWWRILTVYLAGVVAGSLFTSLVDPNVFLAGASGGVYAILTCHIASVIMNWGEMSLPCVQLVLFLVITVADCGTSVYSRYFVDDLENDNKVGYEAHLAGAIAGLLVGILVLKNIKFKAHERIIWWVCLIAVIGSTGIMIVMNIVMSKGNV